MAKDVDTARPEAVDQTQHKSNDNTASVSRDQWNDMKSVLGTSKSGEKLADKSGEADKNHPNSQHLTFDNSIYGTKDDIKTAVGNGAIAAPTAAYSDAKGKIDDSNAAKRDSHLDSGIDLNFDPSKLDKNGIQNAENLVTDGKNNSSDRLRAADALYNNGVKSFTGNGGEYSITRGLDNSQGNHDIQVDQRTADGQSKLLSGQLDAQGNVAKLDSTRGIDKPDQPAAPTSDKPIFDPKLSPEQKLQEADRMFQKGEKQSPDQTARNMRLAKPIWVGAK